MALLARRLIVFAGSTADPRDPSDSQLSLIQGRVALSLDPQRIQLEYPLLPPNSDFYDALVSEAFDKSAYVVLYEAELYDDQTIIVKRDLFGPNDYPLTWSGWPIPGDEDKPPTEGPLPPTLLLTEAQIEALSYLRKKRDGAKTETNRGKAGKTK